VPEHRLTPTRCGVPGSRRWKNRNPAVLLVEVTMNIYARVALRLFVTTLVIALAETERAFVEGRLNLPPFFARKHKQVAAAE
jgi:hypothetical protein